MRKCKVAQTNVVAQRTRSTPTRLLAALALTLAVIAGLLAMHAMSNLGHGAAQPLGSAAIAHSSSPHAMGQLPGDSASTQVASGHHAAGLSAHLVTPEHTQLSAPADSGHTMLLMACALALLVALFVLPILARVTWRELDPMRILATAVRGGTTSRRRPSLIFLSISRT